MAKNKYYTVAYGGIPGVYTDSKRAMKEFAGYSNGRMKGFPDIWHAFAYYVEFVGKKRLGGETESSAKLEQRLKEIKENCKEEELQELLNVPSPVVPHMKKKDTPQKVATTKPQEKPIPVSVLKNWMIYTDGCYLPEINMRAYAAVLYNGQFPAPVTVSGIADKGEAFEMELLAIIKAMKRVLKYRIENKVYIFSDCMSIVEILMKTPYEQLIKKKKFHNTDKYRQKLWKKIYKLREKMDVEFHWVKGHNGNEGNVLCDQLANLEATMRIVKE